MGSIPKSNDHLQLTPNTTSREPLLEFDFPSFKIGIGQYEDGPTGCTVFLFYAEDGSMKNVKFSADIRGGSPGVLYGDFEEANAFCFSGSSLYGIESASGVVAHLLKHNKYSNDWELIPIVPAAIIFDLGIRKNMILSDKALGRAASETAVSGKIPLGRQGAGIGATVGKGFDFRIGEFCGQGASFKQIGDVKILAFTVINAIGAIRDRSGKIVRGHLDRKSKERVELLDQIVSKKMSSKQNTTLSMVITNKKLDQTSLKQIGRQVHSSMSRMIDPFHTEFDGDTLFMVSTDEIDDKTLSTVKLGMITTEVMWDAVLSSFEND